MSTERDLCHKTAFRQGALADQQNTHSNRMEGALTTQHGLGLIALINTVISRVTYLFEKILANLVYC